MGYQTDCDWEWQKCEHLNDFSMFNPFNKPEHYHNLCQIEDNLNQDEMEHCRLANLPDLDQDNLEVRELLYNWIASLTEIFGFDGYRIDTARHGQKDFWPQFQEYAGTFVLGEVAGDDTRIEYDASYQQVMDGVLNFPIYYSIKKVFTEGYPMTYLKDILDSERKYFKNLKLTGTFIDNHDTMRFLNTADNDLSKLRNSLAFLCFGDGIPILYAGTEQEFLGGQEFDSYRQSMWPYFNRRTKTFKFIQKSLKFRKMNLNVIVESNMFECFVDENFYVFKKELGKDKIIVGLTKMDRDGTEVKLVVSNLGEEFEIFEDIYTGNLFEANQGHLEITFDADRDPVVLKKVL